MHSVLISAPFDDLRAADVRLLQQAAKLGRVHVLLWDDELVAAQTGSAPKFPLSERRYFLDSIRFVARTTPLSAAQRGRELETAAASGGLSTAVVATEAGVDHSMAAQCDDRSIPYRVIAPLELADWPSPTDGAELDGAPSANNRPQVVVTGCYDWLHTGHVRFFEEASELGDLHVVVGHDANVKQLKGPHHPLFPQDQRRYLAAAIRFVREAYISTGDGWLDAEPEIDRIKPDLYVVNEDGDRPEKKEFCAQRGIDYRVLVRRPKEGLAGRSSTALRGF